METKMETTIMGSIWIIGIYWGYNLAEGGKDVEW